MADMHRRSPRLAVRHKVWLDARRRFALGAGIELALGRNGEAFSRSERTVLVVTAGIAPWNMGVVYVARLLLHHAARRNILRL
jgi:hypothetical protein